MTLTPVRPAPASMPAAPVPADPAARRPLPAWLTEPGNGSAATLGRSGRRRRHSFLERTVADLADASSRATADPGDGTGAAARWLRRRDPRASLPATVLLLLAIALVHSPVTVALAYLGVVALAIGAGAGTVVRRVGVAVPLATALVLAPATLSIITPGEVVWPLWQWHGATHGVTATGLTTAGLVIGRVACSVVLVGVLAAATPWSRLLAGLSGLGMPRFVVLVTTMAYRYLVLLLETLDEMFLARRARSVGRVRHDRAARSVVASTMGTLVGKAHVLAEEVHHAMTARGYDGRVRTLTPARLGWADAAMVAGSLLVAAGLLWTDLRVR